MLVSNIQCTFNLPARCQIPEKKILKEFMNFLPIGPLLHTLIHQNLISWIHKFNNFGLNDQNDVHCTTVLLIYRIEKREKNLVLPLAVGFANVFITSFLFIDAL